MLKKIKSFKGYRVLFLHNKNVNKKYNLFNRSVKNTKIIFIIYVIYL